MCVCKGVGGGECVFVWVWMGELSLSLTLTAWQVTSVPVVSHPIKTM